MAASPTLDWERELAGRGFAVVAGCDEVGRGSLAGPVSVGVVIIDAATAAELPGVKDSKLLRTTVRESLVPAIKDWAQASAVGHASAGEIDEFGLVAALRLAGTRALAQAAAVVRPDFVILDGNQDWLSEPEPDLFSVLADGPGRGGPEAQWRIQTRIKADMTCLSVAAASVLAKVERDGIMAGLAEKFPEFGWEANMGYGTAAHREAIGRLGATDHHRRSWRLT
ncbi:ribonuclease HII [Arthrobacter stackebrandtii]|uniref:Ribonuclease n=1 Tax=Arthrobacter stackebrandtii TaxID=272161 RepID=A0ABS4YZA8_9MICC|nr:ribonuclease HII [Arthrobacter stackebrandtii]MBP2414127.1 ribonuclease HII [Arthrobacter stackebrandtii]PYG99333.1 ribonuclease HII [Arthrobacter stackebrandtii]